LLELVETSQGLADLPLATAGNEASQNLILSKLTFGNIRDTQSPKPHSIEI
jgi:hypothetical protein